MPLELIRLPRNTGNPAQARNTALLRARGEYIAYLDADDICTPGRIAESVAALELAGPDVQFAFTSYGTIDAEGRPYEGRTLAQYDRLNALPRRTLADGVHRLESRDVHDALLGSSFIRPSQVVVRTGFVRRSRGFDERLQQRARPRPVPGAPAQHRRGLDRPDAGAVRYASGRRDQPRPAAHGAEPGRRAGAARAHAFTPSDDSARPALADVHASLGYAYRSDGPIRESIRAHWRSGNCNPARGR